MEFNGQVKLVTLNQIEHLTRVNAALKMRTGDL
jgi:hypothetical protein